MRLYSTLTRKEEEFAPAGDTVKMYVCGPNLYAPCHVGHAMSYVVFDTLRRYLEYRGYKVRHVQNFTDIEDKIIARAQAMNVNTDDLAREYVERFFVDMDKLNIQRAHVYPLATHEIPGMIEMIQGLIAKGHAYAVDGDVYFRVTSDDDYGKLSGRSIDDLQAGARIEVDERKEHPMDFALWKASKPGEPSWESPWGPGRPGWHIECSVMSLRYLGETLDIHGGGQDLIFPHHENELAQSESYTGVTPFVRFWVHNGLARLSDGEEKMTRSLGNLVSITRRPGAARRRYAAPVHPQLQLSQPAHLRRRAAGGGEAGRRAAAHRGARSFARRRGRPLDATPFRERFIEAMERRPQHRPGAGRPLRPGARHQPRPRRGTRHQGGAGGPPGAVRRLRADAGGRGAGDCRRAVHRRADRRAGGAATGEAVRSRRRHSQPSGGSGRRPGGQPRGHRLETQGLTLRRAIPILTCAKSPECRGPTFVTPERDRARVAQW